MRYQAASGKTAAGSAPHRAIRPHAILAKLVKDLPAAMTLCFPNQSRCFDAKRQLVRFWGHDSALEISFFVEVSALVKLVPQARNQEAGYLEAFDAARDRIRETARRVYSRGHKGAYLLAEADF
jgi:hypothetical protein